MALKEFEYNSFLNRGPVDLLQDGGDVMMLMSSGV